MLRLLEEHPRLPLVVVADSDTVWLQQPWTYFAQRPDAEFFISSDCISAEVGPARSDESGSVVRRQVGPTGCSAPGADGRWSGAEAQMLLQMCERSR